MFAYLDDSLYTVKQFLPTNAVLQLSRVANSWDGGPGRGQASGEHES